MKYKNIKITPKVFRFSSDKPTRILPFQAISLIRPPGLPAEMADRRIWRMKAIVRQLAFVYYPKDFRFLRYSAISSSLTVSQTCCSSLTTKSLSFGR